jgi:hypothetical protein
MKAVVSRSSEIVALMAVMALPTALPMALPMALLGVGCGGSGSKSPGATMPELPGRYTKATLAGPLCSGNECSCQQDPGSAGKPAGSAVKRFEFVLGPSDNELWATVDGMVLYKSKERAKECFYVDLSAPGEHPVTVRGTGEAGFGVRLQVRELASGSNDQYETFDFQCGAPGACRADQLADYRASLDKYKRGLHDPCGSTKVKKLSWITGRLPDGRSPANLHVSFTLDTYEFAPKHPPGDDSCRDRY